MLRFPLSFFDVAVRVFCFCSPPFSASGPERAGMDIRRGASMTSPPGLRSLMGSGTSLGAGGDVISKPNAVGRQGGGGAYFFSAALHSNRLAVGGVSSRHPT